MFSPLRVVFLGSDPIALPMLEWLVGQAEVPVALVAVYTQPDRAVGRGQQIVANGIKVWAAARGGPVLQPEKLTDEVRDGLAAYRPDLALVMAYGHILKDAFIATPRLGTLNFHASILPKLRGASPIQTAVATGQTETGVSLMRIVRRLDAGPVADVERVPIHRLDTAADVEARLAQACVPLLARNLPAAAAGNLRFADQDDAGATYCRRLVKADGVLDFSAPAMELAARINGLFPWPGCAVAMRDQTIKLGLAEVGEPGPTGVPGTVLGERDGALEVATAQGVLRLLRLQRPGARMLAAREFLRGFPVQPGTVLPSAAMPALTALKPSAFVTPQT